MSNTPRTGLKELSNGSGQYLVMNNDLGIIDQLLDRTVKSKSVATPPESPANGDAYIVAASPTGLWSGQANKIAFWSSSAGVWLFVTPNTGWRYHVVDELDSKGLPKVYGWTGSAWAIPQSAAQIPIIVACSDETTALTVGTAKVTFRMPFAATLNAVKASLTTPQGSGSLLTVDINESGASVISTKLTFNNNERTTVTATTQPVISDSSLAADAEMTIDIDQIGTPGAAGLKVTLLVTPT